MQIKPEYEIVEEYSNIASLLIAKYPDVFSNVDVKKIRCVAITNKERTERKKIWEVKAVPMPIKMDCPYGWYVIIYLNDWVEMTEKRKQYLVASSMCAIPEEEQEGKVFPPDLKDYSVMVRTLGVDYMEKPDDELRDIIKENIKWVNRP